MLGVSVATLRRWETQEIQPSPLALRGIEALLLSTVNARPDAEASELCDKLILSNRILLTEGLIGPFGHVSVRSEDPDKFLILGHEPAEGMKVNDIVRVDVGITAAQAREQKLYLEIFIHSAMYEEFPDVQAVAHTHSPGAITLGTLAATEHRVLPTTNPGANLGHFIPVFSEVGLIQTMEKGRQIARSLEGQNGVLLRGHGAVVVGASLEQAVLRAIYLEFEARAQVVSRNAGQPVFYQASESDIFKSTKAIDHAWRYYSDKVHGVKP